MSTRPWMYFPRAACNPHCPRTPPPPVLNFHRNHSCSMLFCRNIPPNTCPPVRSRQVQDPLPGAAATQQCGSKFSSLWCWESAKTPMTGWKKHRQDELWTRQSLLRCLAPSARGSLIRGWWNVEESGWGGLRRWQGWTGYLLPTKATARLTDSLPSSHKGKKSVSPPSRDRMLWEHH